MFEIGRCVFCNRSLNEDQIMFRFPSSNKEMEFDFAYSNMLKAHNIDPTNRCILPKIYRYSGEQQLNGNSAIPSNSVYLSDGTVLTEMICPTCHGRIFRDTDDAKRNTFMFFGEKNSGKTSLIYTIISEAVISKNAKDLFDKRYVPFYNDYLIKKNDFIKIYNDLKSEKIKKPENFNFPVIIHRAANVNSKLENKTDIFVDVTDFDIEDSDHIDMTLAQADNAKAFIFTIPITKLILADDEYYGRDVELRSHILPMYYSTRNADIKPTVFIAITFSDLIYNGTFDADISQLLDNYLHSPDDLFRAFFESRYPLTSGMLKRFFGSFNLCFVKARDVESDSYVSELSRSLYKQLTDL